MAWNYEKGCDEPAAYNNQGPLWNPPPNSKGLSAARLRWEQMERNWNLYHPDKNSSPYTYYTMFSRTIQYWQAVEREIMDWQHISGSSDLRRKYIEWLENEGYKTSPNGDLSGIDVDKLPMMQRIILEGFRAVAKKVHPDAGGTDKEFIELREATKQLEIILREVKDVL